MRLIKEAFDQEYEESKKANEEEFGKVSGKYCDSSTKIALSSELSYNEKNAKELWEDSLELISV